MNQRRFTDPELTRRILAQTSGSACGRAEGLLAARADGALDPDDRELLDGHLGRCEACGDLAVALDWSLAQLPELAERNPGPIFTEQVLARTSHRARRAAERWRGLERRAEQLRVRLVRWWARPRFAWEAAYVGTLVFALAVWGPLAPAGTAETALQKARESAGAVPGLVIHAVPELGGALVAPLAAPADSVGARIDSTVQKLKSTAGAVGETGLEFWRSLFREAFDEEPQEEKETAAQQS